MWNPLKDAYYIMMGVYYIVVRFHQMRARQKEQVLVKMVVIFSICFSLMCLMLYMEI